VKTIIDGVIKNALASVITDGLNSLISGITGLKLGGGGGGGSILGSLADAGINKITGGTGGLGGLISSGASSVGSALGIGGAATGGATAGAVTGGTAGVITTDLGLLGSGASTGTAGASTGAAVGGSEFLAGLGMVGGGLAAYALMKAYFDDQYKNWKVVKETDVTNSAGQPLRVAEIIDISNGNKWWDTMFANTRIGYNTSESAALSKAASGPAFSPRSVIMDNMLVPGYATGGMHSGGLRLVGENGTELEATGPSRIFDAATTASMLRSGGASGSELAAEMRQLRADFRAVMIPLVETSNKTRKLLDRWDGDGLPEERAVA